MQAVQRWRGFSLMAIALLLIASGHGAQAAPADPFQTILDRIGAHAASGEWRKEGWQDKQIESWLDQLVTPIIREAGIPSLKIPVTFTNVRPTDPTPEITGGLVVGKTIRLGIVRRSIVLADRDVEAERVEDSVIVARGSIIVGPGEDVGCSAERSILVAGTYIYTDVCGRGASTIDGNVLISRGWVDAGDAFGSVFLAPKGISASPSLQTSVLRSALGQCVRVAGRAGIGACDGGRF